MAIYGLPALPVAFLYIPLPLLIPAFYAEHLGLSLTTIGLSLLAARIFDLGIDPLLGRLSDISKSRWGRRRPWIAGGALIMMVGTAMVFMPPASAGWIYLMLATMVVYFGASMLGLAYSAWGAEIVETYHGRAKLAGYREFMSILGVLLAASIPAITAIFGHGVDRFTIALMGVIAIILTPPAIIAALRWVPDPPLSNDNIAELPLRRTLTEILKNIPFRFLCGSFVVISIGSSVSSACLVFYISYYLGQPELVGPIIMVAFLSVLVSIPIWVRISRHIGKHRAVAISLLIVVVGQLGIFLILRPGDGYYYLAIMAVMGSASAAFLTLPVGIMGDVIDYDALKAGEQRAGTFFGIWAFAQQIAPAIAIGTALPLLEWFGFNPSTANDPSTLVVVRYIYCLMPLPFYVLGALLLLRFPIDVRRHGIIRQRLDTRRARRLAAAAPSNASTSTE